jgi:DNA-binding transcriptional MerR regulator
LPFAYTITAKNMPRSPARGSIMRKRTISKVADEAGVGVETVRFYERSGVLRKPSPPDQGWRHYPESAVWTIRYVKNAQAMGFSLSDCKKLLRNHARPPEFCRNVRMLAAGKVAVIEAEIQRLKSLRKAIKAFLKKCEKRQASGSCPIYEHVAPELAARDSNVAVSTKRM